MKWIQALDLDRWAGTTGSRTSLSELVSALVRATASEITAFRFPTGDSAQAPGYDGSLEAKGAPPFVPDGKSVWEFGVGQDYFSKVKEDYQNRTENPLGAIQAETTIVFVTLRHWNRKAPSLEEWRNQKTAEGPWKEVRVVDGATLETWLEQCPAVAARFAREILRVMPANGARSTDEYWEEYASRFKPPLTGQVLLCDRKEQAEALRQQLTGPPQTHLWQADSPDEVVAFAIAAVRSAEQNIRKYLEARTLVVDTEDAARQLANCPNLVFFPRAGAIGLSGFLANRNPTVVPLGRDGPKDRSATRLNRPTTHALAEALRTMGLNEEEAAQRARECGHSVTILARRIHSASAPKPEWHGRSELLPALIAGAWDASSPEDQAIIRLLAATETYAEYEEKLLPFLRSQDPPLDREGQVWKVRAPVDAFVHLGYLLATTHFDRLGRVFEIVFSERDPSLDLPDQERPYAQLRGNVPMHSEWLRRGLATTLLLFAEFEGQADLNIPGGAQPYIDGLIQQLPGLNDDWRLLASLRDEFPLLMEAAPRPLLSALERLLEGDGSRVRPIFNETEGMLFPQSSHTGLLWGLEVLAWDPEYFPRVCLVLAALARVDEPPGKLLNRPINSLREIFLPWHACTNATLTQRLATLDQIIGIEPGIAWKLILMLLPEHHSVAQETAKPRYREAGASQREPRTRQLIWEAYSGAIDRALNLAGGDAERWSVLVNSFPTFDPSNFERGCQLLEQFSESPDAAKRTVVWTALNALINRHKAFPNAAWAMDKPRLDRLEQVASSLQPSDPLVRVAWLFNDYHPMLPEAETEAETRLRDIDKARVEAIREVFQTGSVPSVISFAKQVNLPRFVAVAISKVADSGSVFDSLIDASLGQGSKLDEFAIFLSAEAEMKFQQDWKSRIVTRSRQERRTPVDLAALLLAWRDEPETWSFAESLGPEVERSYWQRKTAWPLQGSKEAVETGARKYLSAGRAVATLGAIGGAADRVSADIIFEALDKAVEEVNASPAQASNMFFYELEGIFEALQKRCEVPKIEIARREYAYLPLLEHGRRSLTLLRMMADDPGFFVSVLCDVFKPATGDAPEPNEVMRARARAAYSLLSKFDLVPGQQGVEIDPLVLNKWVADVRELAAKEDRTLIADEYIGHTLAHAPTDADGGWPHRAVRDVIEKLRSQNVERGIEVGRFNMRGAFSKAIYEGGKQERGLADQARSWAKAAEKWPRTHAMLLEIAQSWDAHAEREDQRAKQDEMRYK